MQTESTPEIKLSEDHIYTVGGKNVPGVTDILKSMGFMNERWYTEQARIRGSHIHSATHFFDEGDLKMSSLDDRLKPYLQAYRKFLDETRFRPHLIEKHLHAPDFNYCGTLDRTGWLPQRYSDEYILLDIKSGAPQRWVALQTAAYKHAVECNPMASPIVRRFALRLRDDGTYDFQEHTNPLDENNWLTVVNAFHIKQRVT